MTEPFAPEEIDKKESDQMRDAREYDELIEKVYSLLPLKNRMKEKRLLETK